MKEQIKTNAGEKIVGVSIKILELCGHGKNLDNALDDMRGSEYSSTISDIMFNYFRNKGIIDYIIAKFSQKGKKKTPEKFKRILRVAITQAYFQTGIETEKAFHIAVEVAKKKYGSRPSGFINAVLRNISTSTIEEHLDGAPENINIPGSILKRWQRDLPGFLDGLKDCISKKPEMTFRLSGKICEKQLSASACKKLELPHWCDGLHFYISEKPSLLFERNWLKEGMIYIQDPSTAAACNMYQAGTEDLIMDLCSAPGGKTIILAEKTEGKGIVVSSDLSIARQKKTQENIINHKIDNCNIVAASAIHPPFHRNSADLLFLDVPCSNTGVFRRRPDVLWNFSEQKLKELVELQRKILMNSCQLVKEGGKLIYSTCSIEKEENSDQISLFLKANPEFELMKELQLLPCKEHDGAYSALLTKQ